MDNKKVIHRLTQLNDRLAREQAEQRLDEIERNVMHERQRRGMQPVTQDDGTIIGWVRTTAGGMR